MFAGIDAGGNLFACMLTLFPGLFQRHLGVRAEGKQFFLAFKSIFEAPPF